MTILQIFNTCFVIIHRMSITSISMKDSIVMLFDAVIDVILTQSITQNVSPLDNIQLNGILSITLSTEVGEVLTKCGGGHSASCVDYLSIIGHPEAVSGRVVTLIQLVSRIGNLGEVVEVLHILDHKI